MSRKIMKKQNDSVLDRSRRGRAAKFINRLFSSRWYRTLMLRYAIAAILFMVCIPMTLSLIFAQPAEANDGSEEVFYKYYHRIEVSEGDTLWSIATQNYRPQEQTIWEYMDEVQQINHRNSQTVYAGEELMIPYYSTEFY